MTDNQIIYYNEDAPERAYSRLPLQATKLGYCSVEKGKEGGWYLECLSHKSDWQHRAPIQVFYKLSGSNEIDWNDERLRAD